MPIWQTPPLPLSRGPQAHLPITIHSGAAKRKVLKTFKIGEMWQNLPSSHALAEAPDISCAKDIFFLNISLREGEFWRSPHEHAWNSMTRGNPSPPT